MSADPEVMPTYLKIQTTHTIYKIQMADPLGMCTSKKFIDTVNEGGVALPAARMRLLRLYEDGYIDKPFRGCYTVTPTGLELLQSVGLIS